VVGLAGLLVAALLFGRKWLRPAEQERLSARPAPAAQPGPPPLPRDLQTRIVADGFWFRAAGLPPQSVVRWRCLVGMNPQSGSFTFEPGPEGQFVYTGSTPREVTIVEVLPPEGYATDYVSGPDIGPTSITPTHQSFSSPSPPQSSHRHPPAY